MFIPKRIIFEKGVWDYEIAKNIFNEFKDNPKVEIIKLTSNKIKENIPGKDLYNFYREGKNTLVVGLKKGNKFQTCKPSADYQLPLFSGCIGHCEYCYLNTNLGDKPYLKVNVNIEDIFIKAKKYITENLPETTVFEGSATSDPVPVEPYTKSLRYAIEFFGRQKNAKFRFVTKYDAVDTLLDAKHNENTEIRFTLNTQKVINEFESRTASIDRRIDASVKITKAGYPIGFIIAPIFLYEDWEKDYKNLLLNLNSKLPKELKFPITFEIISHRYTTRAKNIILEVFPKTTLPMNDEVRTFKYGQFGYGKYVYTKEKINQIKEFFNKHINEIFDNKIIKYII